MVWSAWNAGQLAAVEGPHHYERICAAWRAPDRSRFLCPWFRWARNHFAKENRLIRRSSGDSLETRQGRRAGRSPNQRRESDGVLELIFMQCWPSSIISATESTGRSAPIWLPLESSTSGRCRAATGQPGRSRCAPSVRWDVTGMPVARTLPEQFIEDSNAHLIGWRGPRVRCILPGSPRPTSTICQGHDRATLKVALLGIPQGQMNTRETSTVFSQIHSSLSDTSIVECGSSRRTR